MLFSRMQVRPVAVIVLTFALSWAIWIPLALPHVGVGPFAILTLFALGFTVALFRNFTETPIPSFKAARA